MKKLLFGVLVLFCLSSTAQAYFVSFDSTGSGIAGNYLSFDAFNLEGWSIENPYSTGTTNILTYQEIATGIFTESFTLAISSGTNSNNLGSSFKTEFKPDLYIDVVLSGFYDYYTDVAYFKDGSAVMYDEEPLFSGEEANKVAELSFASALPARGIGGIIGKNGRQLPIDITF